MKASSIRFRLAVWYSVVMSAALAASASAVYLGLEHYLERSLNESVSRQAHGIAELFLDDITASGERFAVEEINEHYAPEINGRFVRVLRLRTAGSSVLYGSGAPRDETFDPAQVPVLDRVPTAASTRRKRLEGGAELLIHALPYTGRDGNRFLVEVGAPVSPIQAVLHGLLLSFAFGLPVVVLVAVSGAFLIVRRALGPIEALTSSVERISSQNLAERLPVPRTGDELERLSLALNRMIARLEEAFQQSTRFSADASHELRTPLTILRGELESTLSEPALPAEARERISSALEETERLSRIVEGLLALARLDSGEAESGGMGRFDLGALATETADQMRLLAEDKGVGLDCDEAGSVEVEADRARLKQVVVNLLDNAIKYTPAGGEVRVRTAWSDGNAVLEVSDSGLGIPSEALPHVFERFYRVDRVRSREMGGAGLGLSIVQSVASVHGGSVEVESAEGKGSLFRVVLPRSVDRARPDRSSLSVE